jgi:hypothetical protein
MPTSDEYRKIAEECYCLARGAKTETDRLVLLDFSQTWLEAASREDKNDAPRRRRSWRVSRSRSRSDSLSKIREGVVRSLLMVMAGAILLNGCAATQQHWIKQGGTQEMFMRDRDACIQETDQALFGFYKGESRDSCMEARGYKQDPNGDLFPPPEAIATNPLGAASNPGAAATNPQAAASLDYNRAVADYRNCLAANPSNVNACEGQRHIMDADAQILSGSSQGSR